MEAGWLGDVPDPVRGVFKLITCALADDAKAARRRIDEAGQALLQRIPS